LFTNRQMVALTTFSNLVGEATERIRSDAAAAGLPNDHKPLRDGGIGAYAYAQAVDVYLGFALDKSAVYWNSLCTWLNQPKNEIVGNAFGRQALPMVWDYAEANPLSDSGGNIERQIDYVSKVLVYGASTFGSGVALQEDAATQSISIDKVVSTDPPYYDNVPYADLSDFFYVWLRRSARPLFPKLFATLTAPKAEELVATSYRHTSKAEAETFFLDGMTQAMLRLNELAHPAFPLTIYYAFKQAENETESGTTSTGWETFLEAVLRAGFAIGGTWPMRTERPGRMRETGSNALASSIVLVCRRRAHDAPVATRRELITALKAELPQALAHLQRSNIAPVDLAQAAIGPGMAVYTRYSKVLDAEGKRLGVREALALINLTLDEALAEQEGDFDADSRWAVTWFEQHGFAEGEFGLADVLARAKNTSVDGLAKAGIVKSSRSKVRLLTPEDLPKSWDPTTDPRLSAWEIVHHLIRVLANAGEAAAAALLPELGAKTEIARELAYRLYTLCERKKRPAEALAYNGLVQSWTEILRLARDGGNEKIEQAVLFGNTEE
jgi:putative DNA methylase